jgi:transposase
MYLINLKMPKHHSEDYKLSAVRHFIRNRNQSETCRIFGCKRRSLMRWVDRYNSTNEIKRKNRNYVSYKVKKEYVKFIQSEITKNRTITMEQLRDKIQRKFKIDISRSHIANIVRDNNITLKQSKLRHEPRTRYRREINIKQEIENFYREINRHRLEDIICIDETSINSFEIRKHCYNKLGKRCVIKTENQEVFKKFTCIMAINSRGCIGWELYEKGGIDSERLLTFLNTHITSRYRNKVIILDNASSHRNPNVKSKIRENNKLLYSVPYQHYTNAIENYFSVLKSKIRNSNLLGYRQLKNGLDGIINQIPSETYKKILKGSYDRQDYTYTKKKSNRERPLKNYKN